MIERRTGQLAAYMVGEVMHDEFVIRDFLTAHPTNRVPALLAHALLAIRKLNVTVAGLRITGADDLTRSLSKAGFSKRDPECVFIRDMPASPSASWVLTSADEDV